METSQPNTKSGVVVYLDSLGTKNLTTEETEKFILKKKDFLKDAEDGWKKREGQFYSDNDLKLHLPKPEIATFQDSIIICWSDKEQKSNFLPIYLSAGQWLIDAIPGAVAQYNLFFRGAISVGDYIFDSSQDNVTVLGNAVSDAVQFEGLADWIGVIQTQKCYGQYIAFLESEGKKVNPNANVEKMAKFFAFLFVPYHIPLKHKVESITKKKYFALSWPYFGCKREDLCSFPQLLLNASQSVKEEDKPKYENAKEFFEWYKKNIYPEILNNSK